MLESLRKLLAAFSLPQKLLFLLLAAAVSGGVFWFARSGAERDFRPLYTGLSPEDAGQVVNRLREQAIDYRLGPDGTTVLVRSAKVAEMRLQLAGAGLPKTGRIGFELFDRTNFGSSEFSEQINYRRALEGELERSVMSIAELTQARVHVSFAKDSIFPESRQPAKASVLVKLRPGSMLGAANVKAIEHLLASAVEGLAPEGVTVVDTDGNLLSRQRRRDPEGQEIDSSLELRQRIERDLLLKLQTTLDPVLGADHYRASISADVDLTSGEQSEETWDPGKSVMVSQQRTEDVAGATSASGVPGTSSSLPRPTSRPGAAGSGIIRRTENVTYQTSRLVRRTKLPQGNIRRLSLSMILDQQVRWEGSAAQARRILVPPNEQTIKTVRDLAAGAIGFRQDRGDQITVETLPFELTLRGTPPSGAAPPAPPVPAPNWLQQMGLGSIPVAALLGAGAALVLVVLAGLVLLLRGGRKRGLKAEATPALAARAAALPAAGEAESSKGTLEERLTAQLAEQAAERKRAEMEVLSSLKLPTAVTKKGEVLAKHIAEEAKRNPMMVAQILRTWLQEKDSR